MKKNKFRTKNLTLVALMTAMLCIISPFAIPTVFSPVPITFCTLGIYLTVLILGMKKGTLSCLLYILLGLVGLPVFSGFSGGAGKLFGPTGGYFIGYVLLCLIAGVFVDRYSNKWYMVLLGMLSGTIVCYLFGTLWLAYQMQLDFFSAAAIGVLPYIPADLIKMMLALLIGTPVRKSLNRAHLL
ncbi:MAG: biotin transporter BioY [Lachnospiraceae bacterium]|nr:biotin transporter BioY [Lachnospiraceae bacterium]MBQ7780404.1 biotin transporter BioY [Lachnospiraceae bacterium]